MSRSSRLLFASLLSLSAAAFFAARLTAAPAADPGVSPEPQQATLKAVSATTPDIPFDSEDLQIEQQLLALANQSRHQAGVPALTLDRGLSQAARVHALTMLQANQLSHQFQGELSLPQRLAATTALLLDQEGENVALDYDAEHGHQHLMLSPPHRANLLNPSYNVVGLGVVRSGDRVYIVQDFGHALPQYSPAEVKDRIASALEQKRHQANRRELARHDLANADDAACSMAQADKLATVPVRNLASHFTVLTYTSVRPEEMPREAFHSIESRNLRSFSVGTCYARSQTYPSGVYWVLVTLE